MNKAWRDLLKLVVGCSAALVIIILLIDVVRT